MDRRGPGDNEQALCAVAEAASRLAAEIYPGATEPPAVLRLTAGELQPLASRRLAGARPIYLDAARSALLLSNRALITTEHGRQEVLVPIVIDLSLFGAIRLVRPAPADAAEPPLGPIQSLADLCGLALLGVAAGDRLVRGGIR